MADIRVCSHGKTSPCEYCELAVMLALRKELDPDAPDAIVLPAPSRKFASINKFVEKRQMLERVRLVGPQDKSREVMEALASKGYRLIQSGPYTTKTMFPKVDPDRFLFIAERDI